MSKVTDIVEDLRNIEDLAGSAQEVLVSGSNIKTVGGLSLLGSGDISITSGVEGFYPEKFVLQDIYTTSTTVIVPAGATQMMAYVFGTGGIGVAGTSSGGGGGCAYGLANVTAGQTVTLTIGTAQGSTSKLTYGEIDLLIATGATGATAGTASKDISILNPSGAYSGGAGADVSSNGYGGGASSGSPFGSGVSAVNGIMGGNSWLYRGTSQGGGAGLGGSPLATDGGRGLPSNIKITDPLVNYFKPFAGTSLFTLSNNYAASGGGGTHPIGHGGFGGGGASSGTSVAKAGSGGFGGGGGAGKTTTSASIGGDGGFGGGGAGTGINTRGLGGASCIVIFWA